MKAPSSRGTYTWNATLIGPLLCASLMNANIVTISSLLGFVTISRHVGPGTRWPRGGCSRCAPGPDARLPSHGEAAKAVWSLSNRIWAANAYCHHLYSHQYLITLAWTNINFKYINIQLIIIIKYHKLYTLITILNIKVFGTNYQY